MRRTSIDKIRESLRLQQVYNTFLRYGWDILFDRAPVLGEWRHTLQSWAWDLPPSDEPVSNPVRMRMMLEELGPTYVKVGQIVSSQASQIPPEWAVELDKLQSSVPPFSSDEVREIIIEELKAPPEELFATFSTEPLAAASTAQVHRATLCDGTQVVVKVQRPNIRPQMKADIGIMQNAARVITARSEEVRALDLVGMLDQFGNGALNELDYTGEAYNAMRLAKNMETVPGVHITTVYPQFSTSKVLTMEFIQGVKISNLPAMQKAGLDLVEVGRNAFRGIIKQVLIDGFFHADPHPGNILVSLDTGTVNFLDCGMIGELEISERANIAQLMLAVQQGDVSSMAQIMRDLSQPFVEHVDERAYTKDFERRVGRYIYAGAGISFAQSVNVAFDILRQHGLRINPNLTLAIKSLMQAEAFTSLLDPEGNVVSEGVAMVKDMLLTPATLDMALEEVKKQLTITAREAVKRIPSISTATLGWLDQYQKGRLEVHLDTSDLGKEMGKLEGIGRLIVIGLVLAGMIIGSAVASNLIAANGEQQDLWSLLLKVSYYGYLFSMLLAVIIVLRLAWQWWRSGHHD
jgi:ubiquinone biosynthesis protein